MNVPRLHRVPIRAAARFRLPYQTSRCQSHVPQDSQSAPAAQGQQPPAFPQGLQPSQAFTQNVRAPSDRHGRPNPMQDALLRQALIARARRLQAEGKSVESEPLIPRSSAPPKPIPMMYWVTTTLMILAIPPITYGYYQLRLKQEEEKKARYFAGLSAK